MAFACSNDDENGGLELRIYNWQDYIDEGLDAAGNKVSNSVMEDWAADYKARTGKDVKVVYNTFETNEYMMNVLKTGSEHYDLVCPSDYVIQKMIADDMLEKYDYTNTNFDNIENYNLYASKFIKDLFETKQTKNNTTGETSSWANYAVGYMWGTMGFVYDSAQVTAEDASTWGILWNPDYAGKSTAKNAVHDTYVAGVMYVYRDELNALKAEYEASNKTEADKDKYTNAVNTIMNRFDNETIAKVEVALTEMKKNFYGFEVDNGKTDIVSGNDITINFAWSGDAVYSMDTADEADKDLTLCYSVPEEGSNIWFDGWVMPKGANTELAQDFINYMCSPEIAARNMDTIGYTSCIAGDAIWDLANEWYSSDEGDAVDLTYFFGETLSADRLTDGKAIIIVEERGRQFDAQYPSEDIIMRCGIMEDFGDQNEAILTMWENVKGGETSPWLWIGLGIALLAILGISFYYINSKKVRKQRRKKNEAKAH